MTASKLAAVTVAKLRVTYMPGLSGAERETPRSGRSVSIQMGVGCRKGFLSRAQLSLRVGRRDWRPAAAEGLEQAHGRLQAREPHQGQLILRREQRLLHLEQ